MPKTIYQENGYLDRADYIKQLAEENGVPVWKVQTIADLLGPEEDFDGLVSLTLDEASL